MFTPKIELRIFAKATQKIITYLKSLFTFASQYSVNVLRPRRRVSFTHIWLPNYARIQVICKHAFLQKAWHIAPYLLKILNCFSIITHISPLQLFDAPHLCVICLPYLFLCPAVSGRYHIDSLHIIK